MTTYQIVRLFARYCDFTDAVIGSSCERLPMSYSSVALAGKLADRMITEEREAGGDDDYCVVEYGRSPFETRYRPRLQAMHTDDMPF